MAKNKSASQGSKLNKVHNKIRSFFASLNYLGLLFSVVFFGFSMLPSLLPRPGVYQAIISGVSVAVGYGVGVAISAVVRWLAQRELLDKDKKNIAWRLLKWIIVVMLVVYLIAGYQWQNQVRGLVGESESLSYLWYIQVLFAFVVATILLFIARIIRKINHSIVTFLDKHIPPRISRLVGFGILTLIFIWLISGIFINFFVSTANSIYDAKNHTTPPGISQPTSKYKSGSPDSLIAWNTLGYQGQAFTGRGPNQQQLAGYFGSDIKEPIRVYAGLNSATTPEQRAQLALEELKRTDAFSRKVLILATATGTGWLEPQSVDAIEYMYGGNTAIVSQQYSYLPSWISFLVDKQNATEAGLALYDAVYAEWSKLPVESRPKLIAYGLSLGSFGGQAPYAGVGDIAASIDGALFMGTPNDTRLWRTITDSRDQGSLEILPEYQKGQTVRFAATNEDILSNQTNWQYPRVLYMQHPSDSVVWFSFDLINNKPAWLNEPRGYDVSPATRWFPLVTFLQVTVDQFFGTTVPNGHGHNYPNTIVNAWAAVTNPDDWNDEKATRLQDIIDTYSNE